MRKNGILLSLFIIFCHCHFFCFQFSSFLFHGLRFFLFHRQHIEFLDKGCNGLRERRQCQHSSWLLQPAAGSHLNFTFNRSCDFTFFTYFYKLQLKIWDSLSLSIVVFISLSLSWFLQLQIYICLPMLIWRIQVFKQKAKVFMSTAGPRIWWGDKCIRGGDKGGACFRRRGGKFCKKILNFSSEEEVRKRDLFSQEFCKIYIKFL